MPYYVGPDNRPVVSYRYFRTATGSTKLVPCSPDHSVLVPNNPEAEEFYVHEVERVGLNRVLETMVRLVQLGHSCANRMADKLIDLYG